MGPDYSITINVSVDLTISILLMPLVIVSFNDVSAVINFVGGWLGEGCSTAKAASQNLFEQGARFKRPTLWLYGRNDPFYSISHSQENFAAFQKAGGQGSFLEFDVPGGNGHFVIGHPQLWSAPIGEYLSSLAGDGYK